MVGTAFSPYRFVLTTLLVIGSFLMIGVSVVGIIKFYVLIDEFTVKSSHLVCEQPLNNRCVMHYTVDRPGKRRSDFVPFGDQFASYPVKIGLEFKKTHYGFSYEQDGRSEQWSALWIQLRTIVLGILGVLAWYALGGVAILKIWLKLSLTKVAETSG